MLKGTQPLYRVLELINTRLWNWRPPKCSLKVKVRDQLVPETLHSVRIADKREEVF